jgi:hypothetical protein
MKFTHPANEDFIQQAQRYLRFIITEKESGWPASVCYQLGLFLRLWVAGFFFKAGDTDATPLLGALVVADKTALAHPHFTMWLNERNLSIHLRIAKFTLNLSEWSMKAIIAGEAIYRAMVHLFPNQQITIEQDAKRILFRVKDKAFVFNFAHPEQITITNEPSYIPLTLDIVDGDPNPFIKFDGSWLENEIVRGATLITNTIQEHAAPPTPPEPPPLTGAMLIAKERERQMTEENYSAQHDDGHHKGELVCTALMYASEQNLWARDNHPDCASISSLSNFAHFKVKRTGNRIRDLTRAGALIAAEIDRLQRIKKS